MSKSPYFQMGFLEIAIEWFLEYMDLMDESLPMRLSILLSMIL